MENPIYTAPYPSADLTAAEQSSITHGNFWIPEEERLVYRKALDALNDSGIPYVVTGAHAVYEHTGIYRRTSDLDLFVEPRQLGAAIRTLKKIGFTSKLVDPIWLSKVIAEPHFIDLIFGMGNGVALVDGDWHAYGTESILAGAEVRVAPPEELIWHRLFISERHRQDMSDIAHLLLKCGDSLDWDRLLAKVGPHWLLLLSHIQLFLYVYPSYGSCIPDIVIEDLLSKLREEMANPSSHEKVTRGTLISRFSFAIDVREWGFRDLREEAIALSRELPVIQEIAADDVWDERSQAVTEFLHQVRSRENGA